MQEGAGATAQALAHDVLGMLVPAHARASVRGLEAHACAADSTRRFTFCCCRDESTTGAADSYALSTPATTPLPIPSVAPQSSPLPAPHSPPTPRPT